MGKYKRLGLNTILIFIGNIGSKFISLIMLPFYTRWLSVDDYGITDLITTYVTLILGVVSCCIYESLFVFPKDQEKKKQISYFSSGLLFLFGSAILTFIIFAVVEYFFCSADNSFMNNIWLIYFMLESQLLMQSVQAFVRSIDKIKVYNVSSI